MRMGHTWWTSIPISRLISDTASQLYCRTESLRATPFLFLQDLITSADLSFNLSRPTLPKPLTLVAMTIYIIIPTISISITMVTTQSVAMTSCSCDKKEKKMLRWSERQQRYVEMDGLFQGNIKEVLRVCFSRGLHSILPIMQHSSVFH